MKLPHLDLRPRQPDRVQLKSTVSRKALHAYFDMKFSSQDLTPFKSTARSLSYSKLLQETPDTFRKQRTSRKLDPSLLSRPVKKVNSLVGIQGIKSVLRDKGDPHTSARRPEPKKLMKTLAARTTTQGFRGFFGGPHTEEFDPDVIDICPDLYLREMQLTRRSESTFPQLLLR